MDTDKTKVIFRKWKDGEVIAIFPQVASDYDSYHCMSYMHIGQHSACNPSGVIQATKRASKTEYEPLERELASIGYSLEIIERNRYSFIKDRRDQLHGA